MGDYPDNFIDYINEAIFDLENDIPLSWHDELFVQYINNNYDNLIDKVFHEASTPEFQLKIARFREANK